MLLTGQLTLCNLTEIQNKPIEIENVTNSSRFRFKLQTWNIFFHC